MSGIAIVTIGPKQWEVYLADTYEEIIQGLGEVIGIPPQTGMLFDLGYDQVITVTTVPMLFPLDIVFISSDMRVADLVRDVPPGVMVASDNFARYLLEVNAGEAAGVQIRDEVHVQVLAYPAEIGLPPPPQPSMDDIINFGMTVMAILFMGSIARTAIEAALAPPKPEKKLLIAERKLLPPGEGGKLEHLPQVDKELTGKWFDQGMEAGKTDGWMTVEDTVRDTLEDHPKIRDASDLVWRAIEEWEETDHFQILYGSKIWEDALAEGRGDREQAVDIYSDLKSEFWEGYLAGRKAIGRDIYKIAAELIQQRERRPEKPEDLLRGKTVKWLWEEGAQFVALGKEKMGFIVSIRGGVYPRMLSASIWERDFETPGTIRFLYENRLEATDDNLKEAVNWVVARVPGRHHWQKYEPVIVHAIRAGWNPRTHKRDAGAPTLLPKVEGKHGKLFPSTRPLDKGNGWEVIKRIFRFGASATYLGGYYDVVLATGLTEEEAKRQARELTKSGAKGYMGRTEYMGIAQKIESYVWIRLGDGADYESFDGPLNAGEAVGDRLALHPKEHLILMYYYRDAGVEIEPYFVGDNYISLFWGDEGSQWIRDLSGDEHREFERGVRYGLTPTFSPQTVEEGRKAEDIGKTSQPTRDDVTVSAWSERDRLHIWIVDDRTDKTIAEWWDEGAQQMFEDGFFKPGVPQYSWERPGREFVDSVLDYAENMGWLARDNPFKFSPQTAAGGGKIKARSIILRRLEGDRQRDDFSSHTLTPVDDKSVWRQADSLLFRWAETAPRRGEGYHKVSFIVTYEDGETYQGRFDLRHHTVEYPDLGKHIYRSVAFYAGRYRPPHMTEEQYKEFLKARFVIEVRTDYENFLENYEIGNGSPRGNPGKASPRLIGRVRLPELPKDLEFFPDSKDHIEDSIESNGLHPQLEAIFMEAITRAKAERFAKRMMGD